MTKAAYLELGMIMKPYLKPRITGIDKLSIYMEGFTNYLCDRGINDLILTGWSGNHSYESSAELVNTRLMPDGPCRTLILSTAHLAFGILFGTGSCLRAMRLSTMRSW